MTSLPERRIAIVGRGIAGLTLAFRLLERGIRATVFGEVQDAASRCAQGVVANKGLVFYHSPLFKAKLRSLQHVQSWLSQLEDKSGLPIPRRFVGVDEPYWDAEDFSSLITRIYRQRFLGCHLTRNRSAVHGPAWPLMERQPQGFLHYPADGWFDVNAALQALECILNRGAVPLLSERIAAIEPHSTQGLELTTARGAKHGFDQVILATGAGLPELMQRLEIEAPKMFTIGGQTLEVELAHRAPHPQILVRKTMSATWSEQRLLIGSSSWRGAEIAEAGLVADRDKLLRDSSQAFGWNVEAARYRVQSRVGARLRFADRMPAVGSWPQAPWQERLFIFSGFYKSGLQLADLCALDLVSSLIDGGRGVEFPDFSCQRFFKS